MANPKPNATLYFLSGKTLDVVETCTQIAALCGWNTPPVPPAAVQVTKPDATGTRVWVNVRALERMEPA